MKKFQKILLFLVLAVFLWAGSVWATPFPAKVTNDQWHSFGANGIPTARENNDGIPDINDAINRLLGSEVYSNNHYIDPLFVEPDYLWQQLNGGVALIGLTAGNSNTLGVYNPGDTSSRTTIIGPYNGFGFLGDGTSSAPYPYASIPNTVVAHGNIFGFYLQSNSAYYYSESGLNPGGWDHMMTFDLGQLAGESVYIDSGGSGSELYTFSHPYLLAWEDLNMGDEDYDDMIYVVDKTAPVPEPATLLLLGSGLIGLAGIGRRKFFGRPR